MKTPKSWFLPDDEPVLALLGAQWRTVEKTLDTVVSWTRGNLTLAEVTTAIEQAEDQEREQRRTLHSRVRAAFSTPLDAEDIYELGERIGMFHRQLYLLVREADASNTAPDQGLEGILSAVSAAASPMSAALMMLPASEAASVADEAAERLEAADQAYRVALSGLTHADVHLEMCQRELYRRAEHVTEAAARIAHRTWYAVCKVT